jgi:hypothetical protein
MVLNTVLVTNVPSRQTVITSETKYVRVAR